MKSVVSIHGFITQLLGIPWCANTVVFGKNHGFKPYLWIWCYNGYGVTGQRCGM